jgi:hypothetical protein
MVLEKYSLGIGDRFGYEGVAQLRALQMAEKQGVQIVPVWNKSNREHLIIGSSPEDSRREADEAVRSCGWNHPHYVDADHIGLSTVDSFIESCDFFTIDVAECIGVSPDSASVSAFLRAMEKYKGAPLPIEVADPFEVTGETLADIARNYLHAMKEAGRVYRRIEQRKGKGTFVVEVSLDEASQPQSPAELFFLLAGIALEGIPIQTIAPKFSGSFLKGIDYVGDRSRFEREFTDDLAVVAGARALFDLPLSLKLSIHSGSDKFSLYPIVRRSIKKTGAGLHLKTAGTTWLEEVVGLAASDGEGLQLAKEVYIEALDRFDELSAPYRMVLDIDRKKLPSASQVGSWSASEFVEALRHDQTCRNFNAHFRQLVHVGYKIAAEKNGRFTDLLEQCRAVIEANVTANLYKRHIVPLFLDHDV